MGLLKPVAADRQPHNDLIIVVKARVAPSTLFGTADSTKSVQKFATESVNNRPQVLHQSFPLLDVSLNKE